MGLFKTWFSGVEKDNFNMKAQASIFTGHSTVCKLDEAID